MYSFNNFIIHFSVYLIGAVTIGVGEILNLVGISEYDSIFSSLLIIFGIIIILAMVVTEISIWNNKNRTKPTTFPLDNWTYTTGAGK